MIIKPLGNEVDIGTASSVANADLVRVVNTGAAGLVTLKFANGVTYATFTVSNADPAIIVEKRPTDTIGGTGMKATPVAYRG